MNDNIKSRLEYLRKELRAEKISYGELAELQSLAKHIDPSDVELLEAAGVPERGAACPNCKDGFMSEIDGDKLSEKILVCNICGSTMDSDKGIVPNGNLF